MLYATSVIDSLLEINTNTNTIVHTGPNIGLDPLSIALLH